MHSPVSSQVRTQHNSQVLLRGSKGQGRKKESRMKGEDQKPKAVDGLPMPGEVRMWALPCRLQRDSVHNLNLVRLFEF